MDHGLSPSLASWTGVLLIAALTGCGEPTITTYPVEGKVTIDGTPLTAGHVSLFPSDSAADSGRLSAGQIDASGSFKIHTAGQAGAPKGRYKVMVNPAMVPTQSGGPPPTEINQKYRVDTTTPLEIEVVESPEPGRYDLKLTK